ARAPFGRGRRVVAPPRRAADGARAAPVLHSTSHPGERKTMKLLRYGPRGREKPGVVDSEGNIRDLSKVVPQVDDAMLAPRNLARLARVKPETLPIVRGAPRLGVPYAGRLEEHTSELQSRENNVCRLLLDTKKRKK